MRLVLDLPVATMTLSRIFGHKDRLLPVWAALCEGRADGSHPQYPTAAKHALLAMVHCDEQALEENVRVLLEKNGWINPEIKRVKRLDDPFRSEDPDMLACYAGAVEKQGGIIVYRDPILDDNA